MPTREVESLDRSDEAATLLDEATAALAVHRDAGKLPEWHQETTRKLRLAGRRHRRAKDVLDGSAHLNVFVSSSASCRYGHHARMISPVRHPSTLRWNACAMLPIGTGARPGLKRPNCS